MEDKDKVDHVFFLDMIFVIHKLTYNTDAGRFP